MLQQNQYLISEEFFEFHFFYHYFNKKISFPHESQRELLKISDRIVRLVYNLHSIFNGRTYQTKSRPHSQREFQ